MTKVTLVYIIICAPKPQSIYLNVNFFQIGYKQQSVFNQEHEIFELKFLTATKILSTTLQSIMGREIGDILSNFHKSAGFYSVVGTSHAVVTTTEKLDE